MNPDSLQWPGYYDVVILPQGEVRDFALQVSRRLYRFGGRWRLGKRTFLPHISLYHIPVEKKDFESFVGELQKVVDSTEWGTLEITGFDMPVLVTTRPPWIKKLHRRIVERTVQF